MNQGQWLDPGHARYSRRPYQIWQPPGCLMHEYKERELTACFQSKRLVFIGDSTIRQIFWATAKKLDEDGANDDMGVARKHSDLTFTRNGVGLEFIWDPYLNSSRLHEELKAYQNTTHVPTKKDGDRGGSASLILVGGGLWFARHVHVNTLKVFRDSVDRIIPYMNPPVEAPTAASRPFVQNRASENLLLMAPVQVPQYDFLSPSRSETITAEKVDAMNDYLRHLSTFQEADVVWSFSLMTWKQRVAYEQSGLHVVDNVAGRKADVLLNLRCNAEAALGIGGQGYPYDRTCCSNYRRPGWVQWTGLIGTLMILPFLVWITRTEADRKRIRLLPSSRALRALLVFLLAIVYCFYADRTHVFEKVHKRRSAKEFVILSGVSLLLGLLSVRRSASLMPISGSRELKAPDQPFLSRYQTDEWKGWMQFGILIYHYAGASKILWIYIVVRLLVASYLFMTGFGHTVYFYSTGDYSLRRVTGVLIRLNLLNCVLPYMMRTDYLFYYFAPLVSFWFIVIYLTMRVGHNRNGSLRFICSKIAISAVLTTAFTRTPGPLEAVFTITRYACRLHWDVKEWRFRVSLDMLIVYVGMLAAILFVKISTFSRSRRIDSMMKHQYFYYIKLILPFVSLVVFYIFATACSTITDKYDYNWFHPYISFFPIVAFAILRNSHRHLRNFHSSIFAWLGRCSLETFTLQFHIWMAGDTNGLLSLGMFHGWRNGKWYNFLVVTAVFFYISWRVARATEVLTQWIVRSEEGRSGGQEGLLMGKRDQGEQKEKLELPLRKSHDSGRQILTTTGGLGHGDTGKWEIRRISVTHWKWLLTRVWRCENITTRLGVLTVAMWFLNVTYT
ncbi:hypothetical protein FGG08_002418 [Glutinoglossum americanum]|uniref:Cas1p 10 TM acyl transferase domain-containing protein n=1 Tax=Glutinoglossum americanum TaxID=1670608 RepID=A0A9P8ICX4_9PEZI|nr:hypothetical protein FGG08_002418 [Glutinoglossum americanum]